MTSELIPIRASIDTIFDYPEIDDLNHLMSFIGFSWYTIAGGYFRDKEQGVKFKDVDVFIPGDLDPTDMPLEVLRYNIHDAVTVTFRETDFNLIKLDYRLDLVGILSRMDIGLCQIGLDHQGHLMATQAYIEDFNKQTLTVLMKPETPHDLSHIERVKAKYPEFTLINPF